MRYILLAVFCFALALLNACDDQRTTGAVVEPLVGPRVAELLLALDVEDGVPGGIADIWGFGLAGRDLSATTGGPAGGRRIVGFSCTILAYGKVGVVWAGGRLARHWLARCRWNS